jgi:hypothetical protein
MSENPKQDGCWENMWNTIQNGKKEPFKYVDRLEIAFAEIDTTDPDNASLRYKGPNHAKALATVVEAKRQNPDIQVIAQMAWAKWLLPVVKDQTESNAKSRLDKFARSIPSFLEQYDLMGIDFDWEFDQINPTDLGMTIDYATYLFTRTRESLGSGKIMTITPDGDMAKVDGKIPTENLQSLDIEK